MTDKCLITWTGGFFTLPLWRPYPRSQAGAFPGRCVLSKTFAHFLTSGLLASEQLLPGKDKNHVGASKGTNSESR